MTTITDLIRSVYVRESPLTVNSGKFHKYLGITIDFSEKGKVKFTMYDYIANILEELPEDMKTGEAAKPAGNNLFNTNKDNPEKPRKEESITLHNVTENLLYLTKRARPYLQLGVALLCTRNKYTDKDDWNNLNRVMMIIPLWIPH